VLLDAEHTFCQLGRDDSRDRFWVVLLIYNFLSDPDWDNDCPSCSALADGYRVNYRERCRPDEKGESTV
jgi:hypothetical protein